MTIQLPVPCVVVTGFLGSGKTTLLQHLLSEAKERGRRVAVIVNEVGEIGVDGRIIEGMEGIEKLVELNDGCVCCSIREYEFQAAYQDIVTSHNPELILIETTGLAHPAPVIDRLRMVRAPLSAVVTVVDGYQYRAMQHREPVIVAQAQVADFLVINKRDLLDTGSAIELGQMLRQVNARARIFEAVQGQLPFELLFGLPGRCIGGTSSSETPGSRSIPDMGHNHLETSSFRVRGRIRLAAFRRLLATLPGDLYRAKGVILPVSDPCPQLFNFVCGRWDLHRLPRLGPSASENVVVLIGINIESYADEIRSRVLECMDKGTLQD
jgi:G3E family GTPase